MVLISFNFFLTGSVKCALKVSRIRRALWHSVAGSHTRLIHSSMRSSSIHAFSWTLTNIPSSLILSGCFPLKITRSGSTSPSLVTLDVTARCCFSLPLVRTITLHSLASNHPVWQNIKEERSFILISNDLEVVEFLYSFDVLMKCRNPLLKSCW